MPFTVMSYNILAPSLVRKHLHLYRNCNPRHLPWGTRGGRIVDQVRAMAPDVLCLQELDRSLVPALSEQLRSLGYHAAFFKHRLGGNEDGVAIYVRTSRFVVQEQRELAYSSVDPDLSHNVALALRIWDVQARKALLLANTHLLWNPKQGFVKWRQLEALLHLLQEMQGSVLPAERVPVLVCGDFNFTRASPLWEFVVGRRPTLEGIPVGLLSGQAGQESLGLRSLAREPAPPVRPPPFRLACAGTPEASSNHSSTPGDAECVDFMFFGVPANGIGAATNGTPANPTAVPSGSALSQVQWLQPPHNGPALLRSKAIPDAQHPSDHLFQCARFALT